MKKSITIILSLIYCLQSNAQVIFGNNNYTEYHPGNLPIVISVPHGGDLIPANIPDRTCNSAVTVSDANTIVLAQQIDSAFVQATGCHPYIVYCNLHRAKLDCNRNLADGACGNALAMTAWNEFNNFIETAQAAAQNQFNNKAFYIDLHGHGNPIQRLELGYLLYDDELALSDSVLNTAQYVGYSTIQNLVSTNVNAYSHAELLRGEFALGTLFGNAGYPAVPSMQIPFPGTTTNYYSGGYNAANHTSYATNNTVNGLQIECNYTNVRDTYSNRKNFADSLVAVMINYLNIHQNLDFSTCAVTQTLEQTFTGNELVLLTNPASNEIQVMMPSQSTSFTIEIINQLGQTILAKQNQANINLEALPRGIYFLKITEGNNKVQTKKIGLQ
jgi:N-formylglutamate amidohydrolase